MPFISSMAAGKGGRIFPLGSKPAVIGLIALTAGDAIDTFSWSAPNNNGLAITKYGYQTTTNNGSTWSSEVETLTTSAVLSTQYSLNSFRIRVRAFNAAGWSDYSTISTSATVAWASGGTSISNPTACPAPTCSDCTAPDCSGGCGSCAACGACDCGISSITGSPGTRTATAGTRAAATLGTSSRTCYRWTRSGSTSSDYVYNENSTDACSSAYSTCTAGTCGACSDGSCSACSASTCGCSACTSESLMTTTGVYNGTTYYAFTDVYGTNYMTVSNNAGYGCTAGGVCADPAWYIYRCIYGGTTSYRIVYRGCVVFDESNKC